MNKPELILKAIKEELVPLTEKGVAAGNHLFGGLVLRADDLSPVVAGSNDRVTNPIYHGEIDTIRRFFALKDRPAPSKCIFVASHDPCSMCASAIAWAGFPELWVLFSYEDVEKAFGMPVDLTMYRELFGTDGVRENNLFFKKYYLREEAAKTEKAAELSAEIKELEKSYAAMKIANFEYPGMKD